MYPLPLSHSAHWRLASGGVYCRQRMLTGFILAPPPKSRRPAR
jgi:hypothetical protein